jgi:hypothetical protein
LLGSASRHTPLSKAFLADRTAPLMSASPQSAISAMTLPSIGETLAKVAPSAAAT